MRTVLLALLGACAPPPTCEVTGPADGAWVAAGPVRVEATSTADVDLTLSWGGHVTPVRPGTTIHLEEGDVAATLVGQRGADVVCSDLVRWQVRTPRPVALREPVDGGRYVDVVPVAGDAAPGAALTVDVDGAVTTLSADAAGQFSTSVPLAPGPHEVVVTATQVPEGFVSDAAATALVNAPPPAVDVLFSPEAPHRETGVIASARAQTSDADGDPVTLTWAWSVDGVAQADLNGPGVVGERLTRGQTWAVTVTPSDGLASGPATVASVTVGNAPPRVADVLIRDAYAGAPTTCSWTWSDADGDADQSTVRWLVDGVEVATGPALGPIELAVGASLVCEVQPWDGLDAGVAVSTATQVASAPPSNILVVVLDDVGAYELPLYEPAATFHAPVLEQLASEGLTFDRVWSLPLCAPTRAAVLTGRYPLRTGFGDNVRADARGASISDLELSWAEQLRATAPMPWRIAAVGKWHIATWPDGGGARVLAQGFDTYLGALANLYDSQSEDGLPSDYFSFEKYTDTVNRRQGGYLTQVEINDAIRVIQTTTGPWALWVALHAAHEPFHEPPTAVLPNGPTPIPDGGQRGSYGHMIESADAELGRLLAVVPPDTHVIVLSDNGSPQRVGPADRPDTRLKGSVYEGGVRVPMVIRSPRIPTPGARTRALVQVVDLFPTLVELAGGSVAGLDLDGASLVPLLDDPTGPGPHEVIYTEHFEPQGFGPYTLYDRAIRDDQYKLIRFLDGTQSLYRMDSELREGTDLLRAPLGVDDQAAFARLSARLDQNDLR